jgi:hypothetical protein
VENERKINWQDVYGPYTFRTEDLWGLGLPAETLPIADLVWHFDISFEWKTASAQNDMASVNEVLSSPAQHPDAYRQIMSVDIAYPLDVVRDSDRWIILDGIRRLAQSSIRGLTSVEAHVVDLEYVRKVRK